MQVVRSSSFHSIRLVDIFKVVENRLKIKRSEDIKHSGNITHQHRNLQIPVRD